jgi:hypothetical protein
LDENDRKTFYNHVEDLEFFNAVTPIYGPWGLSCML